MKQIILSCMFIGTSIVTIAQDISGNWQGTADVMSQRLRAVFHITKENSKYIVTFDSPDQGGFGLHCEDLTLTGDSVVIKMNFIGGSYNGKWNGSDEIAGALSQGGQHFVLPLKRITGDNKVSPAPQSSAARPKPQTPQPPFNYISEEVAYDNPFQQVRLAGTLTKPTVKTKFPAVILITGSGPQDRDETIGMHKSFWVIADYLTKQGIAVLRVDDRGVGNSSGDFFTANSADFATDVMAGIRYLKTRKDIDTTKIGLIGHSEGGIIAPYVAARSKDVAFIVMLAGPVVGGKITMYYQAVEKPLANFSEHDRNAYGQFYNQMLQVALDDEVAKDINTYTQNTFNNWKKQQPDSTVKNLLHGSDESVIKSISEGFRDLTRTWWRFFLTYDIAKDVRKLKIPVFALNGEKDEQVDPRANLSAIKKILTQNKNPDFKVYEVPGVNHLFQHCKTCGSVKEYLALEETFDPLTLSIIGNWIKEKIK